MVFKLAANVGVWALFRESGNPSPFRCVDAEAILLPLGSVLFEEVEDFLVAVLVVDAFFSGSSLSKDENVSY